MPIEPSNRKSVTEEHAPEPHDSPRAPRFPGSFIRSRWNGSVPVSQMLWKDMLVHGTTINIVAGLLGLALLASGAPTALGVAAFFAPLPYNVFVFAALWKAAAGLVWLLVVTII